MTTPFPATDRTRNRSGGRHLGVSLLFKSNEQLKEGDVPPPSERPEPEQGKPQALEATRLTRLQRFRLDNFGIRRVERLDGNVGYLDLRRMPVPANAGPAIAAAMELVAGTYALIIDMRRNVLALDDVPPPILDEAREALASRS